MYSQYMSGIEPSSTGCTHEYDSNSSIVLSPLGRRDSEQNNGIFAVVIYRVGAIAGESTSGSGSTGRDHAAVVTVPCDSLHCTLGHQLRIIPQ